MWTLTVIPAAGLGVTVPGQITIPARGTVTFPITVDKGALGPGAVANATLLLKGKSLLHLPITAVGTRPLPNLRIFTASVSSPLTDGGPITIARTLENAGNADAGRNYTYFYLSADTAYSAGDRYIGYCERTVALGAGLSSSCNIPGTYGLIPPLAPGTYHALVIADGDHEVVEGNEGDNVYLVPDAVTVS